MKICVAEFTIIPGKEEIVASAVRLLMDGVRKHESGTLLYLAGIRRDPNDTSQPQQLWMVEGYADQNAFTQHLGEGSTWDMFASDAREKGWLVKDDSSPIGLQSRFVSLDAGLKGDLTLLGSLLREHCKLSAV